MDGFNSLHAYNLTREDFNDVSAAFKGCYDVFKGRRPRHNSYAVAVAQFDCFDVEGRRHDEFSSFKDSNTGRNGVKDRAGTDDDVGIIGIFLSQFPNGFMSPRRRECQFNGRDAAFNAGFRHGNGFFRVVAANDGNDTDFFNFIDDFYLIHLDELLSHTRIDYEWLAWKTFSFSLVGRPSLSPAT